jgi:hypothetical protein
MHYPVKKTSEERLQLAQEVVTKLKGRYNEELITETVPEPGYVSNMGRVVLRFCYPTGILMQRDPRWVAQ